MTMTFADALLYSLLGIAVVFFALVLLILIITIMNLFRKEEKKAAPAAAAPVAAPAPVVEPEYAPGTAGELKLYDTDVRDAAMIMAIVADELGAPLNELRFKSIRELK